MEGIVMILFGLFAIINTAIKPKFYWEHRKARAMRKFWGDKVAAIIYYVIGGALILLGIVIAISKASM